jgi:nicotinamidase-related amidase
MKGAHCRVLHPSNTMLLVVDVQGKLAQKAVNSEHMLRRLPVLIRGCHLLGVPIMYAEQLPDKLGETAPAVKEALVAANATHMRKGTFSCLSPALSRDSEVAKKLSELDHAGSVLLCGIEAHICVAQTCRDLLNLPRMSVHVITDCTSSQRQNELDLGLRRMEVSRVELIAVLFLSDCTCAATRGCAELHRDGAV